jgi:hypothetical protein
VSSVTSETSLLLPLLLAALRCTTRLSLPQMWQGLPVLINDIIFSSHEKAQQHLGHTPPVVRLCLLLQCHQALPSSLPVHLQPQADS